MAKLKLKGKDLRKIGFPNGRVIALAINQAKAQCKGMSKEEVLTLLGEILEKPAVFTSHEVFGPVAKELSEWQENSTALEAPLKTKEAIYPELRTKLPDYAIYGKEGIDEGAIHQMNVAMKLPVAVQGALMPDAHHGYGLPIGGVLATENAVIPYGVGVDIGCRMSMSVFDIPASYAKNNKHELKELLNDNSRFGTATFKQPLEDPIMERGEFGEVRILKNLRDKAWRQLGSSGGGNHFVEFGEAELYEGNDLGLPAGTYLALLTHSGSRGLGATIAGYYTKVAMRQTRLPAVAKHLAWLDLNTEAGQEYWIAMNLAGDYASACHDQIHRRMAAALGERALGRVENHHNFAWKERNAEGRELIVHRKGATPAGKGVLGIIPGSSTAPGFIVRGKGEMAALNSASHGAGRVMSRAAAKAGLSSKEVRQAIDKAGVTVIGSGLDEAPMVYKDIHEVMERQQALVDVIGSFMPKVVRMAGGR